MLVRVDGSEPRENVYQHPHAITISWGEEKGRKINHRERCALVQSFIPSDDSDERSYFTLSLYPLEKYRRSEALQHRFQLCDGCMLMNLSSTFSFRLLRCVSPKKPEPSRGGCH